MPAHFTSQRPRALRRTLLILSLLAFAACLLPAPFTTTVSSVDSTPVDYASGLSVLMIGWLGVTAGMFEWFANPLLLLAWVLPLFRRHRAAVICGLIALGVAIFFSLRSKVTVNDAGYSSYLISLNLGYWMWIASIVLATLAAYVGMRMAVDSQESGKPN